MESARNRVTKHLINVPTIHFTIIQARAYSGFTSFGVWCLFCFESCVLCCVFVFFVFAVFFFNILSYIFWLLFSEKSDEVWLSVYIYMYIKNRRKVIVLVIRVLVKKVVHSEGHFCSL